MNPDFIYLTSGDLWAAAIVLLVVIALALYGVYLFGYTKGIDVGWCDYHFKKIQADRERRARNGQFKSKEVQS